MSRKWEKVYRKYLDNADLSYSEMGKMMDQYRPKKLYRYMRFDNYWEKNVFEGQVYLSEANNLNDPFDCLVYIKYSLQGTTQGRYLTGGVPPVRFSM